MAIASSSGIGMQYVWGDIPGWTAISFAVFGHLALVWLLVFTRRLLTTNALMPLMDKALLAAIVINAGLACSNFVFYTSKVSATVIALTTLLLLVCSSIGAIRGQRSAVFFTLAFVTLFLGTVANSLRMLGVLPINFLTSNGIQIGSVLEMILLSFMLADRFHTLRAEKERTQQRLVETLQNSEAVLEARVSERTEEMRLLNKQLESLSSTDSLTGIANRRRFDEVLLSEWVRAARIGKPLALAMVDVDQFKAYNDLYGHQAGDKCLRLVAETFAATVCRTGDLVARYGGEEFAFIAPMTDGDNALVLARKACEAIKALEIEHSESPYGRLTISIGVAVVVPGEDGSIENLIARADAALYQAKANGRNRVVLSGIQ
jgi:diguanylate cyclase (GGDEF)-like protein